MGDILYLNVFTVFVCLLINTKHAHCITLKLQNYNPVEGRQFELDCNTVSTIVGNVVILFPDGTTAGSCTPAISPFPSSCSNAAGYTASISESTFNVTLTTNSLPSDVNGTWTCTHSGDSETYNLNNILQINNEAFDIQPGSFSNNITSSSDVSLSATYGCINEAVSFKWTLVSDLSSTELTRRPSTVKLNTSICTTDPGLDGYSETIASNELFTMYPNLDGDYRLGVEVHYEGEVVAIQSIQYFDTYFIFSGSKLSEDLCVICIVMMFVITTVVDMVVALICILKPEYTIYKIVDIFDCCFESRLIRAIVWVCVMVLGIGIVVWIIPFGIYITKDKEEGFIIGSFVLVLALSPVFTAVVLLSIIFGKGDRYLVDKKTEKPPINDQHKNKRTGSPGNNAVTPDKREQGDGHEGRSTVSEKNEHTKARHVATSALDSVPLNRELPAGPKDTSVPQFPDVETGQRSNVLAPLPEKKRKKKKKNKNQEQTDVV